MGITTISSREFNQDVGKAKRAAKSGPVFITDRGRTAHVLVSIEEFQSITGGGDSIVDMLSLPEDVDIEFAATPLKGKLYHRADLSER